MRILSLLTTLFLTTGILFSQEITAKYDVALSSDDPSVQAQLGMMQGSTYAMYIKEKDSRVEMNMGGGLMKTVTIFDGENKKGIILRSGMMGKTYSTYEAEGEEADTTDIEFELVDETKEILGYTCNKAIMYSENSEVVYWYTKEIDLENVGASQYLSEKLPGFPIEFSIKTPKMNMEFTATSVEEKVENADEKFDTSVPEGYTEMDMEKLKSQMGQ